MALDKSIADQCRLITKEIKDNPLSFLFKDPILDKEYFAEYKSKIAIPMDLSTVQQKLKDNKYENFQQWADDMIRIFDNAVTYNTAESVIGGVAIYLKKKTESRIRKIYSCNIRNYEHLLLDMCKQINYEFSKPPSSYKVTPKKIPEIDQMTDFTTKRIESLIKSLNELIGKGKITEILDVLSASGEHFSSGKDQNTDLSIDLARISRKSLLDLEAYIKANND